MSKSFIKEVASLFLITLVAGVLLGLVYEVVKDPIAKQQQKQKEDAYKTVFRDATDFSEVPMEKILASDTMVPVSGDASVEEVMQAEQSGTAAGYVMTVVSHEGYGGDIKLVVGIRKDGTVTGIEFLSISETAGLGMKAKEDSFKSRFADKKVPAFVYTKSGASADNEIDALTGATVTTNAVTNAVNTCLAIYQTLEGGAAYE